MIDASTKAGAADYTKSYTCSVQNTQGTDTIYLDIKAKSDMDYIYVTQSQDNGNASPFVGSSNLMTDNGKTVAVGSNTTYSYQIAPGINDVPAFKLKIPVSIRTGAAKSDVYNIWMTNGTGSFSQSGKKTIVGPLRVALIYGSVTPYITATGIKMGDQTATDPSYLTTDGVISSLSGGTLYASDYSAEEKTVALNSADINLVSIGDNALIYGNNCGSSVGAKPYFIGVGYRKNNSSSCVDNIEGTDITKFALYTGTKSFADLTGDDIVGLSSPTLDKVEVTEGGVYIFLTADGRLGVIKATGLSKNISGILNATVNVDVKVSAVATK